MFMQFKVWKDVNERGKGGREKEDERHRDTEVMKGEYMDVRELTFTHLSLL